MSHNHRRASGIGLTAAISLGLIITALPSAMSSAAARPPVKPGTPTGLTVSATKPGAAYRVASDWSAAANATRYHVAVSIPGGALLDDGWVTATNYTSLTTKPAGTTIKVSVTAYNGRRHGKAAWKSIVLPDLTAPVASYTLTPTDSSDGNVTIEMTGLSDDVSSDAAVTQHIDWGDGNVTDVDGTVASIPHGYGAAKAVYYPLVTLTDEAGNSSSYPLTAVVADVTAPTGTFSVSPSTAWARWTRVTVTQTALSDDLSAADKIARVVDWGDGSTDAWTSGNALTHVYATGGVRTPTVTIADEAGNTALVDTSAVNVAVDSKAPRARLFAPAHKRHAVRSWTTLRGRAKDAGTGVRSVRIRAIEKRGSHWYAYRPGTKTWVLAGKRAGQAWHKARTARVKTDAGHLWRLRLRGLARGTLVVRYSSIDNVGNANAWRVRKATLLRR
jgi:hypothetical protein